MGSECFICGEEPGSNYKSCWLCKLMRIGAPQEDFLRGYAAEIEKLRAENDELLNENRQLRGALANNSR